MKPIPGGLAGARDSLRHAPCGEVVRDKCLAKTVGCRVKRSASRGRQESDVTPPHPDPADDFTVKTVFFSYAGRDGGWVNQFKGERYFVKPLGNFNIFDYMVEGDTLPFGKLDEWLRDTVNECVAIFVFLSKSYLRSPACRAELEAALDRLLQAKILFIPVMLDVTGKAYWEKRLKNRKMYEKIFAGYMYADFTIAGRTQNIIVNGLEEVPVTNKIMSLADYVRALLELETSPPPPPPPPPAGNLVLLGDPKSSPPDEEFAKNFEKLSSALAEAGIAYKKWPHAWRKKLEKASGDRVKPPATFLQIVSPMDIDDGANPSRTMEWIRKCERVDGPAAGRVILWNPDEQVEVSGALPELRQESAEALANWLSGTYGSVGSDPDPLLLIIDDPQYEALEDAPYSDVVRMVCELTQRKFRGNSMNAEEFTEFVRTNEDRKLIIAVLDNNVNMTMQDGCAPLARFEQMVEDWQDEIDRINADKDFVVEVVWVAVMVQLAKYNPLSTWNKRTQKPIHVLKVFRKDKPGKPEFEPELWSARRVAAALKRLVESPAP
jgi:hypothetical protein